MLPPPQQSPSDASATPLPFTTSGVDEFSLLACLGGRVAWTDVGGASGEGVLLHVTSERVEISNDDGTTTLLERERLATLKLLAAGPATQLELHRNLGESVWLKLRDGTEYAGRLHAFDATSVALVGADDGVRSVPRGRVESLESRAARRRFGVHLSLLPGVMVDADHGIFRGYLNAALAFPAALDGKLWGVSAGLGVGLPILDRRKSFKLDVLANVNVMGVETACPNCNYPDANIYGFGVAAGFHDTLANGFSFGVTVPILGYAVAPNYVGSTNAHVGNYYLSGAVAMPLGFVGYRF